MTDHKSKAVRTIVALIPARRGSKGLKDKNLAPLHDKPLIGYTLDACLRSSLVQQTCVSSDDPRILQIAEKAGAKSIIRPSELATDEASANGVVEHFISTLASETVLEDPLIVYLQPTSPLRNEHHIDELLARMLEAGVDSAMSVVEAEKPPHKAFALDNEGRLASLFDEKLSNMRRQDLPRCYYPNGAIYAFRMSAFASRHGFPSNGGLPFIMSAEDSIDIDSETDLANAEMILGGRSESIQNR